MFRAQRPKREKSSNSSRVLPEHGIFRNAAVVQIETRVARAKPRGPRPETPRRRAVPRATRRVPESAFSPVERGVCLWCVGCVTPRLSTPSNKQKLSNSDLEQETVKVLERAPPYIYIYISQESTIELARRVSQVSEEDFGPQTRGSLHVRFLETKRRIIFVERKEAKSERERERERDLDDVVAALAALAASSSEPHRVCLLGIVREFETDVCGENPPSLRRADF